MRNKILFYVFLGVILFIVLLNLRYPVSQYLRYNDIYSIDGDFDKISTAYPYSRWAVIKYIRENTPLTSKFLVFRQSDFVAYAQRVFVIKTDPRLIEFYNSNSIDIAYKQLVDLGIDYIYVPATPQPTIYNSHLDTIISDPRFTRLEYEKAGWRLFKLLSMPVEYETLPLWSNDLFEPHKWQLLIGKKLRVPAPKFHREVRFVYFKKILSKIRLLYTNTKLKLPKFLTLFFHEQITNQSILKAKKKRIYVIPESQSRIRRLLYSGTGSLLTSPQSNSTSIYTIRPGEYYRFGANIKGHGRCDVYLVEYDSLGEVIKSSLMWTGYLSDTTFTRINGVAVTSDQSVGYRLAFWFPDQNKVILKEITLERITYLTTG